MELLRPPGLRIHHGKVVQDGALVLDGVIFIYRRARKGGSEYSFNLAVVIVLGVERVKTVVGETAAHRGEEIVTLPERFHQGGVGTDLDAGGLPQPLQISLECPDIINAHHLVRPPCRQHLCAERMLSDLLVPTQVIRRVIGRADHLHVELADKRLAAELLRGEFGVALLEDLTSGLRLQNPVYSENPAEFQMRPVIERIPHQIRHRLSPFLKLFPRGFPACDIFLRHAVRPQRAPFVVVAAVTVHQPKLGDVAEPDVLGDLSG